MLSDRDAAAQILDEARASALLPTWEEAQAFIHVAQPDPLILSAFRGDVGGPVLGARYVVTSPLAGREG